MDALMEGAPEKLHPDCQQSLFGLMSPTLILRDGTEIGSGWELGEAPLSSGRRTEWDWSIGISGWSRWTRNRWSLYASV